MRVFRTRLRARYADTDATGIVYYGSYQRYFEVGRVEMFRELGLPYDWRLPIVETRCRYRASARFDDLLEVRSCVEEVRTRAFRIGQQVHRVDAGGGAPVGETAGPAIGVAASAGRRPDPPELLVEGHTVMMTQDESGPIALPPHFRQAFGAEEFPS
jgi:acyl-CoA thioester hydrolase